MDYTSYVNIKQGTASEPRYSNGNTLPLLAAPWGMNAFCLQTKAEDGGWFYHPYHKQTEGIRLTHQPSPWVRDYGHLVLMPQSGEVYVKEHQRCTGFTELAMNPAFMEVYFKRYHARMNLAVSERAGVLEISWNTRKTKRFAVLPFEFMTELTLDAEQKELKGYTNAYGDGTRKDFKLYFCMKFDRSIDVENTVITKPTGESETGLSGSGVGVGISIALDVPEGKVLTVRLGTSFFLK